MTRENAKELLPIITAYAEGKTIEYHEPSGEWSDIDGDITADFSSDPSRYRIKVLPLEIFRIMYINGELSPSYWLSFKEARDNAKENHPGYIRIVRYVETPLDS